MGLEIGRGAREGPCLDARRGEGLDLWPFEGTWRRPLRFDLAPTCASRGIEFIYNLREGQAVMELPSLVFGLAPRRGFRRAAALHCGLPENGAGLGLPRRALEADFFVIVARSGVTV